MLELFLCIFGYTQIDYDLCIISKEIPELSIICEIPKEELELFIEVDLED